MLHSKSMEAVDQPVLTEIKYRFARDTSDEPANEGCEAPLGDRVASTTSLVEDFETSGAKCRGHQIGLFRFGLLHELDAQL
jgi:hypothetical protein